MRHYVGRREGRGYVHHWVLQAMNYLKMAIALIELVASAVAQAPKKMSPGKPNLSDSFTKTCLKALLAIRDFKGTGSLTGPAKDAFRRNQHPSRVQCAW
jgi:hypothetical protein